MAFQVIHIFISMMRNENILIFKEAISRLFFLVLKLFIEKYCFMAKIRITESQLRALIAESAKKILSEIENSNEKSLAFWTTPGNRGKLRGRFNRHLEDYTDIGGADPEETRRYFQRKREKEKMIHDSFGKNGQE